MTQVGDDEREAFFRDVDAASRRAVWAALAPVDEGAPRVRLVHPTWEDDVLWVATFADSPKVRQLRARP
ncbi:MAG: hypothetical protein R3263_01565, partial [Myxococcota bacterium]|nr:hypothetical protein [Myxococcota bacterium]